MGILDAPAATAASVSGAISASLLRSPTPTTTPNVKKMAGAFAAGHGWTALGGGLASSNLNDTSDVFLGSQSVRITSLTTSGTSAITKTGLGLDFTGCDVRVFFKFDSAAALSSVTLLMGDAGLSNRFQKTILEISTTTTAAGYPVLPGGWGWTDIPWSFIDPSGKIGTPNRAAIDTVQLNFINKAGQAMTARFAGIAAIPQDEYAQWPNGVVSLTADDCYGGQYTILRPMLDAYGDKMTLFPILGNLGGSYFSEANLLALREQGHEIGAHASSVATHTQGLPAMSEAAAIAELEYLRKWGADRGIADMVSFAYPNGDWSRASEKLVSRYFSSGRLAFAATHSGARPDNQFHYRAVGFNAAATAAGLQAQIDQAKASRGWLPLVLHDVVASGATGLSANQATVQAVVDYCHAQGVPIRTVGEVVSRAA